MAAIAELIPLNKASDEIARLKIFPCVTRKKTPVKASKMANASRAIGNYLLAIEKLILPFVFCLIKHFKGHLYT